MPDFGASNLAAPKVSEARKHHGEVTSVSVGGATTYIARGEIDVPSFALGRPPMIAE
jgi:hypothetical protein